MSANPHHTLQFQQITLDPSSLCIQFHSYKHSHQHTPTLTIQASVDSQYCPVAAMRAFLAVRPRTLGPAFMHQDGSPVSRLQFSRFLKLTLSMAGLPEVSYNTHSFRVGRATQLAIDNHADQTIRSAGRWKSDAFKGYIRSANVVLPK